MNSKEAAKERLHLVLMQDRANVSADFLELMKQEIIEVIKKYIDVDENAIDVRLTNKGTVDGANGAPALYANIPIINIKNEARKVNKEKEQKNKEEKEVNKDIKEQKSENKEELKTENKPKKKSSKNEIKEEKIEKNKEDEKEKKEEKVEEKVEEKEVKDTETKEKIKSEK